jgi:outer membrane protein assembly factor BamD (BamD/ComL family)
MEARYTVILFVFFCMFFLDSIAAETVHTFSSEVDGAVTVASKPQKRRRIKKRGAVGSFMASPSLSLKNMSYEQLSAKVPVLIKEGNLRIAGKYLKHMLSLADTLSTDPDVRANTIIQIADLLFQRGKYDKAVKRFMQYSELYPGDAKHAEYAAWRACEASVLCLNTCDRCQQKTHATILLVNTYLDRPLFTAYRNEVQTIRDRCYTLLVQSEMNIWSECLKNNNKDGATAHLAYVENDIAAVYPPALLLASSYKTSRSFEELPIATGHTELIVAEHEVHNKPHMADRF